MRNEGTSKSFCTYHETTGYHTNNCRNLMRFIDDMVKKRNLNEFIMQEPVAQNSRSPPKQVKGFEGLLLPHGDIRFTVKDLTSVTIHTQMPWYVVELVIDGWDCRKILIDQGSTYDTIYLQAAEKMQLTKEGTLRANNSAIMGFNGSRTYPMGESTMIVEDDPIKTNVAFLILNTKSPYDVIFGRDWIHAMQAIPLKIEVRDQFRGIRNQGQSSCF
ncbi:uncharacterized protein LOC113312934 [Papaver somniferum]|uniref:uncharacterized protein LOC113312934 n=1 Tax=Papaver somniferum TaxID=3469 RepID=UPI000E6F6753|nr:uncharacterized protein LOC113312934 [Papaver somniferum]